MKWTIESARARLEQEIREAEARYANRVARLDHQTAPLRNASQSGRPAVLARWAQAKALHDSGLTYAEVGARMGGVTAVRARDMCMKLERQTG